MFKKARKEQSAARVALIGPSGSGKTYSALAIGRGLGKRIAVIDTERGSASKYAGDVADFDVCELETFAPEEYIKAIKFAASEGYDVIVIDSLSHAWSGTGGALEMVDKAAARSRSGNSFAAWREVTPHHHALVDAILRYPGHVIATMRAKTEWVIEEDARGKKTPRKIGLAPIQRDGLEYEFDVVADMDHEHRMIVGKTRCSALDSAVIMKPGDDVASALRAWLSDGHDPLADVLAELEAVHDVASLARAKESARRVFRVVTNGRREKLSAAVADAEARVKPVATVPPSAPTSGRADIGARLEAAEAACSSEPLVESELPAQLSECANAAQMAAWMAANARTIRKHPDRSREKVRERAVALANGLGLAADEAGVFVSEALTALEAVLAE